MFLAEKNVENKIALNLGAPIKPIYISLFSHVSTDEQVITTAVAAMLKIYHFTKFESTCANTSLFCPGITCLQNP